MISLILLSITFQIISYQIENIQERLFLIDFPTNFLNYLDSIHKFLPSFLLLLSDIIFPNVILILLFTNNFYVLLQNDIENMNYNTQIFF